MKMKDTSYLSVLNSAIARSRSIAQEYRLLYLKSAFLYYNGRVADAFRIMDYLINRAITNQDYYRMLGLWSLQSGSPQLAVEYFENTQFGLYPEYDFYRLIACLESGNILKADSLLSKMDPNNTGDLQLELAVIKEIVRIKDLSSLAFGDIEKYQVIRYRSELFNSEDQMLEFLNSINNREIRTLLKIELAEKFFDYGDLYKAQKYLDLAELSDSDVLELLQRRSLLELNILKTSLQKILLLWQKDFLLCVFL